MLQIQSKSSRFHLKNMCQIIKTTPVFFTTLQPNQPKKKGRSLSSHLPTASRARCLHQVSNSAPYVMLIERVSFKTITKNETGKLKTTRGCSNKPIRQTSHPPLLHEAGTNVHPASDIVPLSRTSTHKTPSGFSREISKMPRSMHSWPTKASKSISFHMKDILFEDPSINVNLLVADLSSPRKLSFFWISAFFPGNCKVELLLNKYNSC